MGDFYKNAVNNPFKDDDKPPKAETKKRGRGRPKNPVKRVPLCLTVSEDYSRKIDKMIGIFGPTRSSSVQYILKTFFETLGDDGLKALIKANRYGNVIEKRRQEQKAAKAFHHLQQEYVVRRSGGWLGPNGESNFKNLEAQWAEEENEWESENKDDEEDDE